MTTPNKSVAAQLSQAGEDAKRSLRHLNFFGRNTVCTIKSAPPKSPEVLNLLATHSGWIYKRNESHVWQARWCCVVPHMFFYYFDDHSSGTCPLPPPTAEQQDEWNRAIANQQQEQKKQPPHNSQLSPHTFSNPNLNEPSLPPDADLAAPAGIIDLECYTQIHQEQNAVLKLAGDEDLNPDLREFYFCALDQKEEWMQAILHNRHSALMDEVDAYKQVCDGFSQQLQALHEDLDQAGVQLEEYESELYRVRSQQEDARRQSFRLVEEVTTTSTSATSQQQLGQHLERMRAQDWGITSLVQMLCDHIAQQEKERSHDQQTIQELREQLQNSGKTDQAKVNALEEKVQSLQETLQKQQAMEQERSRQQATLLEQTKKELDTVQKALSTTQLEMTMQTSQQRNTVKELQQHKKILKREFLELRSKHDQTLQELAEANQKMQTSSLQAQQEEHKNNLLERYVEKIESQVQVQQNMMEFMSQSGSVMAGGSVYGGGNASFAGRSPAREASPRHIYPDEEDEHDNDEHVLLQPTHRPRPRKTVRDPDLDNKSHVSELTEDRTQRHFESLYAAASPRQHQRVTMPLRRSPRQGPPSFIIGVQHSDDDDDDASLGDEPPREETNRTRESTSPRARKRLVEKRVQELRPHLDTIASSAGSLPPTTVANSTPRRLPRGAASVASEQKLSVAQRARLDAERNGKTTPVRARPNNAAVEEPSPPSGGGLWRRMEEAVLGPRSSDDEDDSSFESTRVTDYTDDEEKKTDVSLRSNLSLQQRSQLQREKQLRFLREQGLIQNELQVKGGACDTSSVASSPHAGRKSMDP